ncbi:hypothetical protein T459_08808 [Capsicum annuum]|uniref:Clathrin heavy chain 1-like n=1 Tax=Capsicum annuum TaxID=4072 RepID=A0A2G2ZXI5_CAPAN|nr:hypothetical protein T459_08808 [Capsicum annuum]
MEKPLLLCFLMMTRCNHFLSLEAQVPGTSQDHLQIFNIEAKQKMKSYQMPEQVLALWDSEPIKMFDRTANLANNQIINYRCDPSEKWLVLIGIAPGLAERPQLVKGNMQLYSVDQQHSQALEAHAAAFASFRIPGNERDSILISFATKSSNAGQVTSKLRAVRIRIGIAY